MKLRNYFGRIKSGLRDNIKICSEVRYYICVWNVLNCFK